MSAGTAGRASLCLRQSAELLNELKQRKKTISIFFFLPAPQLYCAAPSLIAQLFILQPSQHKMFEKYNFSVLFSPEKYVSIDNPRSLGCSVDAPCTPRLNDATGAKYLGIES